MHLHSCALEVGGPLMNCVFCFFSSKTFYLILWSLKLFIEAGEGLVQFPSHSLDLKVHVLAAVALAIS